MIFLIVGDLERPELDTTHLIVQFLDGYVAVVLTPDGFGGDWFVLAEGMGELDRSEDGRRQVGSFGFDAEAAGFPLQYLFAVLSFDGDDLLDQVPNEDQPSALVFPTQCSLLLEGRAEVVVAAHDVLAVRDALRASGLQVSAALEETGVLTVDGLDDATLRALGHHPAIRSIERPRLRTYAAQPTTPAASWPAEQVRLPEAWAVRDAHPTHVAVLDTGVDAARRGLDGRVGAGFDAVAERTIPAGARSAMGDHGTAVAGVIANRLDRQPDVIGVNPGAVIRPVRVSGHDGCITSDNVVRGLEAVLAMPEVRLVNLSFGGAEASQAETAAIDRLVADGRIVIAATGNDGEVFPNQPRFPASLPTVIGVGASAPDRTVAFYSQPAAAELLAPGGAGTGEPDLDVAVHGRFDTVDAWSGTSLSTPMVAGALSLWLGSQPTAGLDDARSALQATTQPAATPGAPGILDVAALLTSDQADAPTGPPSSIGFVDVDPASVHAPSIARLVELGVTQGITPTTYNPAGRVTRAQMATFLARALQLPPGQDPGFPDVAPGNVHAPGVAAIRTAGITQGRADGTYDPTGTVTRAEMATFLARAAELTPLPGSSYSDVDVANVHAPGIEAVRVAGITSGLTATTYGPAMPVRRDQMASFLVRMVDLLDVEAAG